MKVALFTIAACLGADAAAGFSTKQGAPLQGKKILQKVGHNLANVLTAAPGDIALEGEKKGSDDLQVIGVLVAAGFFNNLWRDYNNVLGEKPILTKACTSLLGFSIGDTLAQKFVNKGSEFDFKRLARMAAFGFLFHGTISHFFYNKLDEVMPGTAPLTIVKKVFTDQVLWAPIFTFVYLTWMGVTDGLSPSAVGDKIKNDLVKGVVGSWSVWPIVHAVGFKFVPTEQRLLYINTIQIGYNVFLSLLGSNPNKVPNAAQEAQAQVRDAGRNVNQNARGAGRDARGAARDLKNQAQSAQAKARAQAKRSL
jgi:protein Mpv17